ncbi:hypothetical protein D3C71_1795020 [compost metagenome]
MDAARSIAGHHIGVRLIDHESVGACLPRGFEQGQVVANAFAAISDRGVIFDLPRHQDNLPAGAAPRWSLNRLNVVFRQAVGHDQFTDNAGAMAVLIREGVRVQDVLTVAWLSGVEIQALRVDNQGVGRHKVRSQSY